MTTLYDQAADFTEDAVAGFADLYRDQIRLVPGGAVRRRRTPRPKVAIVVGGGSGHYPAFAGLVGPGLADGAVIGNLFTSPSTAQAYSVARACHSGAGVVFTYGNYAGDVMNFGLAGRRLRSEGVDARQLIVTDDIASAPPSEREARRGIAGDFFVFKILGAAAERGLPIDDVMRVATLANDRTFTLGIAFSGCHFPGAHEPHFRVPEGQMSVGLGIHGEPGLEDVDWMPATQIASLLVDRLLAERPDGSGNRIAVLLNGLGSTKYEELFLLWGHVAKLLRHHGLEAVAPEVGELVTSLDMAAVSLTFAWLDDELESLWLDAAETPAWRRGAVAAPQAGSDDAADDAPGRFQEDLDPEGSPESVAVAARCLEALQATQAILHANEEHLGRIDAVAGDGDHGRGMVRGIDAAVQAADAALSAGWGAQGVLAGAGDAWAERAGGTSGVLWGAALRAFGNALGNADDVTAHTVSRAADAFLDALVSLGQAEPGDKTMVDAALPFTQELRARVEAGSPLAEAWLAASQAARAAAFDTAQLRPKKGRARPLADRSEGHPDPGAISFAMSVNAVAATLGEEHTTQEELSWE